MRTIGGHSKGGTLCNDSVWRLSLLQLLPPQCSSANPLDCVNRAAYVHDVFLASDTTVALLSDVPSTGPADAPIPFGDAIGTQDLVAQLAHGGAPRLLLHDVIAPNFGDLPARLDGMAQAAATKHVDSSGDRMRGLEDVLWAILNANEFLFQH